MPRSKFKMSEHRQETQEASFADSDNHIVGYLHCRQCLEQRPEHIAPAEWARLEVGWTELGLQVWCLRHDCNIMHIDFQGVRHPANLQRKK